MSINALKVARGLESLKFLSFLLELCVFYLFRSTFHSTQERQRENAIMINILASCLGVLSRMWVCLRALLNVCMCLCASARLCVRMSLCAEDIWLSLQTYITALKLKVVFNFICAVIVGHLALLYVRWQVGRQAFSLDRDGEQERRRERGWDTACWVLKGR